MPEHEDARQEHTVTIGGIEHTMLLDDDDAKRYGDAAVKGGKVASKVRQPANKSG